MKNMATIQPHTCVGYGGVTYSTTTQNITGLLAAGSAGVNHGTPIPGQFLSVSPN